MGYSTLNPDTISSSATAGAGAVMGITVSDTLDLGSFRLGAAVFLFFFLTGLWRAGCFCCC
jgi:hypothetical protein